jgi:hypothetical protein
MLFLGSNTKREQGKKVQIGNIQAAKVKIYIFNIFFKDIIKLSIKFNITRR